MLLLVGVILILAGYLVLFSLPSEANFERITIQAIAGMGVSIAGGVCLMIYIYIKNR